MPNISPLGRLTSVFLLKTYDNAVLVRPFTLGYNFINATVTLGANGVVDVDVSGGGGGSNWLVTGNAGAANILGTTTPDNWEFISSGLSRGGFKFTGEFFLKTHVAYTGSEYFIKTNGVDTTDATLTTLFAIPVTALTNNLVTVKIQARRDTGLDRAAFERKAMYYREGAGAVLSTKVHTIFTDKTDSAYDVTLSVSGNNLLIQVKGKVGHNLSWTGVIEYQGVSTSV
jgi:hypothetical protein